MELPPHAAIHHLTTDLNATFILSIGAFLLSMVLTPVYTYFAYRYKFWKKQRSTSTLGEKLQIFTKLHQNKFTRNIPTMAGIIGVIAISVVTLGFNWDRAQTQLPLAALIGGAAVGLLDDIINIRGQGKGVAGLRSSLKFVMIILMSLVLGWFFYAKLGYTSIHVPFVGDWQVGVWIIAIFVLVVVSTGNAIKLRSRVVQFRRRHYGSSYCNYHYRTVYHHRTYGGQTLSRRCVRRPVESE